MGRPRVIAVLGPTASGKSALALALAGRLGGEIVNCDSLQVYRYFDIGTAKVSEEERRSTRHHLIDIINPDELFTAGDYSRIGRQTLAGIAQRGNLPIIVGGTGFYLKALLDGLFQGPARDDRLRERLVLRNDHAAIAISAELVKVRGEALAPRGQAPSAGSSQWAGQIPCPRGSLARTSNRP